MKKKLLLMTMSLTIVGMVFAQPTLVVDDFTLPQSGGNITVTINLDEADYYNSYGFEVVTPTGFSYPVDGNDLVPCELDGHAGNLAAHFDESERVLKVNFMQSSGFESQTLTIRIPLEATAEDVGTIHEFTIKGIFFITTSFTKVELSDVVTFDVTIGEPDDGRIHFDETSTTLPAYTAGTKGNVTMKRTIKANEWSTLVLPFNLTKANATAIFGSDVQMAKFAGFEVDYGDDEENITPLGITINFISYSIPARGNLPGGTPILIKTSLNITEPFSLDDVTLTNGIIEQSESDEYDTPGKFTGSLVKTTVPADGLFLNGNKFWYSTGATNIKAFRGWFELGAVLDKETDFGVKMYVYVDDDETSIEGLEGEQVIRDDVYDIMGRKVSKPEHKGIYIVGGKKILFK